jgi:hypothetical protein
MLYVSQEALNQAEVCQKNFSCLSAQGGDQCEAAFSIRPIPFLRVNKCNNQVCPYSLDFEDKHYCTCPVRIELFKHYKI